MTTVAESADVRAPETVPLTLALHVMTLIDPARYDAVHGAGQHAADLAAIERAAKETR